MKPYKALVWSPYDVTRGFLISAKWARYNRAYPSKIKTLVVSDIPGDDITQVASGPTLPSNGGASDAINCLNKYKVVLPEKILNHIKSHNNQIPNINDLIFKKNSDILLASAKQSMKSVCNYIRWKSRGGSWRSKETCFLYKGFYESK